MKTQKYKTTTKTKQTTKTKRTPKETHTKQNKKKEDERETHPIFPNDFSKSNCLFELFKAICFSILLPFTILAMRLFIMMNFLSLNL